ncbi:MAG: DUF2293 domain-containing protein [Bryobacteraceae bacterium]
MVVQFSRTRNRYERQGILIEPKALERAEQECSSDADARARARAQGAKVRRKQDRELVVRMTARISELFPGCPPAEAAAIAAHTAVRGSGRVGRTEAGRNLHQNALIAAVTAAVRHRHSDYDSLLASGVDRAVAREQVADHVWSTMAGWKRQS